jgi:ABC-2 type transport system ATP-binding protein
MIRGLLNKLSKDYGTTLFLTSHDTADIEQVCNRVIVLDKGAIITDSSIRELKKIYSKKKILTLSVEKKYLSFNIPGIKIIDTAPYHYVYEIDTDIMPIDRVIQETLQLTNLKDITIEDLPMEEIIRILYSKKLHV